MPAPRKYDQETRDRAICGDGGKQGPIIIVDGGPVDLAAEYLNLMAQDDDLEILGAARTDRESSQLGQQAVEDVEHGHPGWRHRAWSAPVREFPSPTGQ